MIVSKNEALSEYSSCLDIIDLVDGQKTVAEISTIVGEEISYVTEKLALMKIEGFVDFEIDVSSHDVFVFTQTGYKILFSPSIQRKQILSLFGREGYDIIKVIDGTKSVTEIAHEKKVNISEVQEILSLLLTREYIAHVLLHVVL